MATSQLAFSTLTIILFLLLTGSSSSTDSRKDRAGVHCRDETKGTESQPQVSSYANGIGMDKFTKDIKPLPQVTSYVGKYASSIEPQPQVSNYGNRVESGGKFFRDIQSQPQISSYNDK